ncbi:MAG TPA: DUF4381 family protein [Desulfocapsa sulfexigens]|nr:DUF4381 family protein [Desulfocapsa sulfexigens]
MNPTELRDIHPPLLLPEPPDYTVPIVTVLLLLTVLAVLFWFFRLRKRKISLPLAHETALADLARARTLMSSDRALQYAAALSDILRGYIEKRFRIRTTRQTTKEFFAALGTNPAMAAIELEEHHDSLKVCLDRCDMAKFARQTPDRSSMEKMETAVHDFIEATRKTKEGGR